MEREVILEVSELVKKFEAKSVVGPVSFSIYPGEIVGMLGPNGAGKTTTIGMVMGVLEPTSGSVKILGIDQATAGARTRTMASVNFSATQAHVPGNMTVWQNLYIFGLLYDVSNIKERIQTLLEEFDLVGFSATKAGLLSSGEQTRVNLAKAMLNKPRLLLLDEPTASLDPSTARMIRDSILGYVKKENASVLWTSHNMHEVESVCDRVFFLSHGKILLEGDPKTLPHEHGKKNLEELFITIAREPLSLDLYE